MDTRTESLPELEHLLRILRSRLRRTIDRTDNEFRELDKQDIQTITQLLERLAQAQSAVFTRENLKGNQ